MLSRPLGLWGVLVSFLLLVTLREGAASTFNVSYRYYALEGGCNLHLTPYMDTRPINNATLPDKYGNLCDMAFTTTSLDAGAAVLSTQILQNMQVRSSLWGRFRCAACRVDVVSNCTIATPSDKYQASATIYPDPATYYSFPDKLIYFSVLIPVLLSFWLVFFIILRCWSRENKTSLRSEFSSAFRGVWGVICAAWSSVVSLVQWFVCLNDEKIAMTVDNEPKPSTEMTSLPATSTAPPPYQLQQGVQPMVVVLNGVPTLVYVMPNQLQPPASRV